MLEKITQIFLEETSAIPVNRLLAAISVALLCGLLIAAVYRMTFQGVLFSRQFVLCLILMTMITCCIVVAISSNLVLSLGMVGALSIVRFRTAIKEPLDTVFMFWALTAGIIAGAGFMIISLICTAVLGVIFVILQKLLGEGGKSNAYMILVRTESGAGNTGKLLLQKLPKARIRSERLHENGTEIILEVRMNRKEKEKAEKLSELPGVKEVNIVSSSVSV